MCGAGLFFVLAVFTGVLVNIICGYFSKRRLLEPSLFHKVFDQICGNLEIRMQAQVVWQKSLRFDGLPPHKMLAYPLPGVTIRRRC
jgi:hypothetical protein